MSPRLVWKGLPEDLAVSATFIIAAPFGEYPIYLILPRTGRWELLGRAETRPTFLIPEDSRRQIEALIQEMPVDIDVVLGTADMTMQELAELKEGDTVILRRKTTEPLDGLVAGARKFRVWPGVIGARAAVLIESQSEE